MKLHNEELKRFFFLYNYFQAKTILVSFFVEIQCSVLLKEKINYDNNDNKRKEKKNHKPLNFSLLNTRIILIKKKCLLALKVM